MDILEIVQGHIMSQDALHCANYRILKRLQAVSNAAVSGLDPIVDMVAFPRRLPQVHAVPRNAAARLATTSLCI